MTSTILSSSLDELSPSRNTPHVLLVEGRNDQIVINKLLDRSKIETKIPIVDKQGVDNLLRSIRVEIGCSRRVITGVVIDANDKIKARWESIRDRVKQVGITLPKTYRKNGTIVDCEDHRRVGVWIMPNNESAGGLEDFVRDMIPSDDDMWPMAVNFVSSIPMDKRRFRDKRELRSQIHSWLSGQERPGLVGSAISSHDLSIDNSLTVSFLNWIQELFSEKYV